MGNYITVTPASGVLTINTIFQVAEKQVHP